MSIAKRVAEAIEKTQQGDAEAALIPACIAVDATAGLEHPTERSNAARNKRFLRDSMGPIGLVGLKGIVARQIKVPADHPDLRADATGHCALEDVIYSVVRCGLLHEATIAEHVSFSPTTILGIADGKYELSDALPLGLVLAVVLSPVNAEQRLSVKTQINLGRGVIDVDALWGKRMELGALVAAGIM